MHPPKSLGHIPNPFLYDYRAIYGFILLFLLSSYSSHAQLAVELQVQPLTCTGANDATVSAMVNGGVAPYQYAWNTGDSSDVLEGLPSGTYTLTVSDSGGEQVAATALVNPVSALLLFLTPIEASCQTSTDGELLVEAFGGSPPYNYIWSNGNEEAHQQTLKVGDYRVTVTDVNGCQQESSIYLGPQSSLNVGALGTPASCVGVKDGFATASAQYGQQPYSYSWDNGGNTQVLPNLDVGTYQVTVTDAVGCVDTAIAVVQSSFDIQVNGTALLCGPGPTSTMTIVPVGGTSPYEYHWNTGAESPVMSNLSEGEYTVTVSDANGCKMTETLNIEPFDFSISVIPRDVLCHGDSTGSIIVQVSGGDLPYTYTWSNGDTTDVLTELPVGSYAVTVADANGCELSESLDLTAPTPLLLMTEVTEIACGNEESGIIKINPSGGKPPYSFLWSNNQIWDEIDNLSAGTYTVTVSDANLCEEILSIELEASAALAVSIETTIIDCDNTTGSLTAVVDGGTVPYSYLWSNGDTTATSTGLSPGVYQLTVTDANNCQEEVQDIELITGANFDISFDILPITCSNDSIGVVMALITGGAPPFDFSWSNGQTGNTIKNLKAGAYQVTVTDANGCEGMAEAIVEQTFGFSLVIEGLDIACAGQNNGRATAMIEGGTPPFLYNWNTGATGSSITSLEAGTYMLSVTDGIGCAVVDSVTIFAPDTLLAAPIGKDISCFGAQDGAASVEVSGGVPPYEYAWGDASTTALIEDLAVGIYGVIIRDANNCITTASITISEPPPLALSLIIDEVPCEGNATGEIRAVVEGGLAPYSYEWSNGDSTSILSDVLGGQYSLTVTDAGGCEINTMTTLTASPGLEVSVDQLDIQCFGQTNGRLTAIVGGGQMPFEFAWNTGSTSPTLAGLGPGEYGLLVTDANNCFDTITTTLIEPPAMISFTTSSNISCAGAQDGRASIMVSGGVSPYSYAWGNGSETAAIENLIAGNYGVIVEDANGCIQVGSVVIEEPPALSVSLFIGNEPCAGNTDGMVQANVEGGIAPYRYRWNTGDSLAVLEGIAGGVYQLTVSDASACEIVTEVTVEERPGVAISLFKQDIPCFGDENGRIQAAVEGGTGPFEYAWTNGASTASIENLPTGTHGLTVTDASFCSDTASVVIREPDSLSVLVEIEGLNCYGETSGKATVRVSGGIEPYLYQWSNDSTGAILEDLIAGDYELSVVDAQACQDITKVSINSPDSIEVQFFIGQTPCADEQSGQVSVEVLGGTPEYSFNWSTGGTKSGIANVGTGWYYLTVTDANACAVVNSIFLPENPKLLCSINIVEDIDEGDDGSLEVIPIGGTSPYSFLWNTGDTTAMIDSLNFGDYSVTVTDFNGCTTSCMDTLMGLATLGSFVWLDENRNGIQEEEEPGFANVVITIEGIDDGFSTQTVTDESGFYQLTVPPGRYQLVFVLPSGFILTQANQGENDEKDSDVDPISFKTDTIQLRARDVVLNLDAGCINECEPFTQPGVIATSTNYLCGAGNDPGPIINQVSPSGGNGAVEYMWMRSNERGPIEDGYWEMIPDSNVPTYDPGPLYETTYFVRCARREKCPTFVETNVVRIEVGTEAVAEVALPALVCEGDQVIFSALGTGPTAEISWTFTGSAAPNIGSGEEVDIRYSSFGSFSGTLMVSENDCIASRNFSVNVTNNPILCTSGLEVRAEVLAEEEQLVRLRWEIPVSDAELSYELQHSPDGESYESLAYSIEPISWEDNQWMFSIDQRAPKKGRNFFRIKVTDEMDRALYSAAKEIVFLNQSALALLYPNPVTDHLYLEFFETYGEEVKLELYSYQGHLLQSATLREDEMSWQFSLEDYVSGLYFVRVYFGDVPIKHLRFYKQ